MANVPPANLTITSTIGPGITATATLFTRVVALEFDFVKNTIKVTHADGLVISYYDYSAVATVTWTPATATISIS